MSATRFFPVFFSLAVILSCKGPKVISFTNPSIDFSQYKTYRIISPNVGEKEIVADTSNLNQEIEELIRSEMTKRGYQLHSRGDLKANYNFISNNRTDIDIAPDSYYGRSVYYPSYDPYNYPYAYQVRSRNFYEAILLIELKDKTTAKTVWQGSLDLRYTKKIKEKKDILPEAIAKIFGSYPYLAGSNEPVIPLDSIQ